MQYAGRLEEPAASIESVSQEFQHMTVSVAMQPIARLGVFKTQGSADSTAATVSHRNAAPLVETLRTMLRHPTALRTAFVAMELLGKPRGLQ